MNQIMWSPNSEQIQNSQMYFFMKFVNKKLNISLNNYSDLYEWSITNGSDFWGCFWEYSKIIYHKPFINVVDNINKMPGAKWFEGATINFAENLLQYRDEKVAIHFYGEDGNEKILTYKQLYNEVSKLANSFRGIGVKKNDRIVGFMPNIPETIIAMLATASIGAIWSSCSPDFGTKGVLNRFSQIEPKVIITASDYIYNGKTINCLSKIKEILSDLPSIEKTIIVPFKGTSNSIMINNSIAWDDFLAVEESNIIFEYMPFDHPLYIMYSSGTTGLPKSIVHSAGGTLIQHLKELMLHTNLTREDNIFYFTTCGWMMWNWLVSSLAIGSTIVLYDGSPFYPNGTTLLKMAERIGVTVFGTSAKYISALEMENIIPKDISTFPTLRCILSTGSPLVEENYDYIYNEWKKDIQLCSISGGTDIISCFALGNPMLSIKRGELQCRGLGMKVESYSDRGDSFYDKKGELVCTQAFPSMPIYFWNDKNEEKYFSAYFDRFPSVWHHGDYISISKSGGVKIFGRSDTTLNPGGVRIGTSEIYQTVERFEEIDDSLVIGQSWSNDERIVLFLKMKRDCIISEKLIEDIKSAIRDTCSPRHVPQKIVSIKDIPYTINGKKVELAVKNVIQNMEVKNKDALTNPESLDYFKDIAELNT